MATYVNDDSTMEVVMKNIYTSCDPENSNLVPVSKIIEFITPYILEDLPALESLRSALDPHNTNVCINSEQFYEVMNEWTKKIANSSDEESGDFNKTPSHLDEIDDKQLPYLQSTPRASFGQKLLSCEGLLNLSNVSAYSLSTSMQAKESDTVGDKTVLEEEIKRLEHQLNRVSNEMSMVKLQLTVAEEQNEILHADLDRCKTRLRSEQQVIDHLQSDKRYNDELREELNYSKKCIEELNKKIIQYEKDNQYFTDLLKKVETENTKMEERCEALTRREQEAKKEIFDIKTELDLKDQEMATILKINDELKIKLNEQKDIIDQLSNENELLEHKKSSLEKALRENVTEKYDSIVSQYKTCLADSSSVPDLDHSIPMELQSFPVLSPVRTEKNSLNNSDKSTPSSLPSLYCIERSNIVQDQLNEECYLNQQNMDNSQFQQDSLHEEICQVSFKNLPMSHDLSVLSFERNEKLIEFEEDIKKYNKSIEYYKETVDKLERENISIQTKLELINNDNEKLRLDLIEMKNTILILENDVNNLSIKNKENEDTIVALHMEKDKIENEVEFLQEQNIELNDENNNLLKNNESIKCSLDVKSNEVIELEDNLLKLKQTITVLENELNENKNKFNFEPAYKKLQKELSEKITEIEQIRFDNDILKADINKITTMNQELLISLENAEMKMKARSADSEHLVTLNENIEQSASQLQVELDNKNTMITDLVDLNKKFASNVNKLEEDLQFKINEVIELKDTIQSDMDIKNILWKDNKELKSKINTQIDINNKLMAELEQCENKLIAQKEEYSTLLSKYNQEVTKNCDLCDQILSQTQELSISVANYHEETSKNQKLSEQVSSFKNEINAVKENQNEYKEEINKKLSDYEDIISKLELKLEETQSENNTLKTQLESEKSTNEDIANLNAKLEEFEAENKTLKIELENQKTKKEPWFDFNLKSSDNIKNRSFEKQKMTIDRLKEKLENVDKQLQNEKTRRETLQKVVQEKEEVEAKYKMIQSDFKELEKKSFLEHQHLQNVISSLSAEVKVHKTNYAHLENITNENNKSLSLKLSEVEKLNQRLCAELSNKEAIIKNISDENETVKNLLRTADRNAQELSTNISTYLFSLAEKDKEINMLKSELVDRNNKTLILTAKNTDLEIQLSKISLELNEKQSIILDLEKENKSLQDMLSKSDDHKEKELIDIEQKLTCTHRLLRCAEMELSLITKKVTDSNEKYNVISKEISEHTNLISNCGKGLSRAFCLILNKCQNVLEGEEIYTQLILMKEYNPSVNEDYLLQLNNMINCAVSLLEIMANRYPKSMEDLDCGQFQYSPSTVKKFTLRPSRLSSRPVSPDSPCVEFEEPNKIRPQGLISSTPKEIYKEEIEDKDDSFLSACEDVSFTQCQDYFELTSFQEAFPNVSDNFLEKLGLQESSPNLNLTNEETEKLFATFAIKIAIDAKDVKERLQKQTDRCTQQHDKFLYLLKNITARLRDHNCIGAIDPINPVFILLEDVKFLLRDIIQSATQNGILTCECRMMKCWNLVTNYMAVLKQSGENLKSNEMTRDKNISEIKVNDRSIRKRVQKLSNKDLTDWQTAHPVSSNDIGQSKNACCSNIKITISVIILLFFVLIILIFSIHWQCRITASEGQMCILDDFIKQIQVGNPPY